MKGKNGLIGKTEKRKEKREKRKEKREKKEQTIRLGVAEPRLSFDLQEGGDLPNFSYCYSAYAIISPMVNII